MEGTMKKLLAFLLLVAVICGCTASQGSMKQDNNTAVNLSKNNYTVVKAGAKGESQGFYLLGFIPIVSPNYADAKANLYSSSDEKLEGRSIALANQTQDQSAMYFVLFSLPRITITADIVEFKDEQSPKK